MSSPSNRAVAPGDPASQALAWVKDHWLTGSGLGVILAAVGWVSDWSFRSFLGLAPELPKPGGWKDNFSAIGNVAIDTAVHCTPLLIAAALLLVAWFNPRGRLTILQSIDVVFPVALRTRAAGIAVVILIVKLVFVDLPFLTPNRILDRQISAYQEFSAVPGLTTIQSTAWRWFVCAHFPELQSPEGRGRVYATNYTVCKGAEQAAKAGVNAAYWADLLLTALVASLLLLPGLRGPGTGGSRAPQTLLRLALVAIAAGTLIAQGARTVRTFDLPLGYRSLDDGFAVSVIRLLEREEKTWLFDRSNNKLLNPLEGDARKSYSAQDPPKTEDVIGRALLYRPRKAE